MKNITAAVLPEKIICSDTKEMEHEKLIKEQEDKCLPALVGCVGEGKGKKKIINK